MATVRLGKRALLRAVSSGVGLVGPLGAGGAPRAEARRPAQGAGRVLRVGAVNTPDYSGLLDDLIADFGDQTGYQVRVTSGEDVYDRARLGEHDLVISHYGKEEVEPFVAEGLGLWPRTVFANQQALLGPPGDPAGVRGLADAIAAYRRIAEARAPYLVNAQPGVAYLEAILWHGAGRPDKGEWYLDPGLRGEAAIAEAARRGAYTLWGAFPFLRLRQQRGVELEPLVLGDSLLQRIMVTVVVNPERFPEADAAGAAAFERYLLSPAVQARIRTLRPAGVDAPLWWPAARHNNPGVLPT